MDRPARATNTVLVMLKLVGAQPQIIMIFNLACTLSQNG
jgi:hypothetical protein